METLVNWLLSLPEFWRQMIAVGCIIAPLVAAGIVELNKEYTK